MKLALYFIAFLAVASCQTWRYAVSSDCSSFQCPSNTLRNNFSTVNYTCPKSGNNAFFRNVNGNVFLDLITYNWAAPDANITLPLFYNQNTTATGVQYYSQLNSTTYFTVLNCTIPAARKVSRLCNSHQLVGTKNNGTSFINSCDFGLDFIY